MKRQKSIVVFEHETLRYDKGEKQISEEQFKALEQFHGNGVPYYKLCYHGVQFNEYVGVIQIGNTLIEVLPKADNNNREEDSWRDILIGMMRTVGSIDINAPTESHLKIRPNTILDLYFEMFVKEVEYLLHIGLIKQYRKKEENATALKGSLVFSKQIQQNIVHQERFFVRHGSYDVFHTLHFILYKTLRLLLKINTQPNLQGRIGALLLHFPEMPDVKVTHTTFERIVYNRKNMAYKKAIEIAKLLLLQYHPDLTQGPHHVLALMFDMNVLWEKFVFRSLRKAHPMVKVESQVSKHFWRPTDGYRVSIRPDMVLKYKDSVMVLDTKWKNLDKYKPSVEDLRQMFTYGHYFEARDTALIYPGLTRQYQGLYYHPNGGVSDQVCHILPVNVENNVKAIEKNLQNTIKTMLNIND